jgi:hypothetical protein
MRLPALLLALLASLPLLAVDEKKPTEPAAKPAEKPELPVKKKKKGLDAPEIPAGVSLVDGVKLQEAWLKRRREEERRRPRRQRSPRSHRRGAREGDAEGRA